MKKKTLFARLGIIIMLTGVLAVPTAMPKAVYAQTQQGEITNDAEKDAELKKAEEEFAIAKKEKEQAQSAYNQSVQTADTAKSAYDAASNTCAKAQSAYDQAVTDKKQAQTTLEQANTALAQAKEQQKQAQAALESQDYQNALNDLSAAQAEYQKAKADADSAASKAARGSLAFFEEVGAEAAVNDLNGAYYKSYTHVGDAKDATSLDHMKESLAYIRECNDLRKSEGLEPLLVSYELMAIAQSNANASAYTMNHTQQFYVAENLAWGVGTYIDPFYLWYDYEKSIYEQGGSGSAYQAGHYLNIVGAYTATGYGISSVNQTHSQTFDYYCSDCVTVDEMERQLLDYCNSISPTETAKKVNQANDKVTKAQARVSAMEQAVTQANTKVANASAQVTNAQNDLNNKSAAVPQKTSELEVAKTKKNTASETLEKANEDKQKKYEQLTAATAKYQEAKNKVNALRPQPMLDGVCKASDGSWYYYVDDEVQIQYTGFQQNVNGWWYVKNGKVDFSKKDVMKGTVNGQEAWWYVSGGKVQLGVNSVEKNGYGWWRIENGKVNFDCNSVEKNQYGWWRIVNGKVDFTCNTVEKNEYGWWYCKGGKVDFSFNGIGQNKNGRWYCSGGKVDFSKNGYVWFGGYKYLIKGGKVQ